MRVCRTCVCLLAAIFAMVNVAAAEQRPNFILFMTDDQGYGDVGYMGHPHIQTPVLDEMARSALRMDRFYAAAPVCSPTRASVLTGRHPFRAGVMLWGHAIRPHEQTIADVLRDAGYRTGFFGKWHLGSVRANQPTSPGGKGFDTWLAAPNFYMLDPWFSRNGTPEQIAGEGSMVTVHEALKFIEGATAEDKPFLVLIWTGSPHTPHEPTPELRAIYSDLPDRQANYYAEVTGIDRAMGVLRQRLRELNIADRTVLWFTSDNGGVDPGDNGPLRGQKQQLWEGGIRVPALVEWPGQLQARLTHVAASTVDIYPTLLELAGVAIPESHRTIDGISLTPLFRGQMDARPKPMGFWHLRGEGVTGQGMRSDEIVQNLKAFLDGERTEPVNEGRLHPPGQDYPWATARAGHVAWIDQDWKLIRLADGEFELYNLANDPSEQHNIIEQHPQRARKMRDALKAWQADITRNLHEGN